MFSESSIAPGTVLWRSFGAGSAVIPADGCADLILRAGDVFVSGPSTTWITSSADGDEGALGLRFSPGVAAAWLGNIDLAEIRDRYVPVRDVLGPARAGKVRSVMLRAHVSPSSGTEMLRAYGDSTPAWQSWASHVGGHARRGDGSAHVARSLSLSDRTFRRRTLAVFGYSYSTLVRIERARRARAILRDNDIGNGSLADVATRAGYADQPHLSREFRSLFGVTPGQFSASSA